MTQLLRILQAMATITDPAEKHQYLRLGRLLKGVLLFLGLTVGACSLNLQPGMLVDRIKNRGPLSISSSNPYLVANQYLEFQRENNVEISQFLASRGSPAALEIQKPLFTETSVFLYYPENGEYYLLTEGSEALIVNGPYKLSQKKMRQIRDVTRGIPAE